MSFTAYCPNKRPLLILGGIRNSVCEKCYRLLDPKKKNKKQKTNQPNKISKLWELKKLGGGVEAGVFRRDKIEILA